MRKLRFIVFLFVVVQITIGHSQNYSCPQFQLLGDYSTQSYSVIYPIGWSKDGKFAFIHHDINPLGAALIFRYNVIIQDMRSNQIVWSQTYEKNYEEEGGFNEVYDGHGDTTKFLDIVLRKTAWPDFYEELEKQLSANKIIQTTDRLMPFPYFKEGYQIKEASETVPNEPSITRHYTIVLARSGIQVAKLLYEFKQEPNEDGLGQDPYGNTVSYLNFEVMAYFKSPFDELYGMFVVESSEGYEEPWEFPFVIGFSYE